ncbi:putative Chitin binding Peritrophin-A domain-containing protein 37 [Homarus americanus]|uniref:Putative Chitin binding Peritrophin-A domain-containing protein 37 n=1 Tax=Homarus americanus TaxID=6706 RepID=A0A8J5MW52_HOMAM|nr:putative Chitin binding Peritrophin-A domain-containing protein 37 [Homarus americanus]
MTRPLLLVGVFVLCVVEVRASLDGIECSKKITDECPAKDPTPPLYIADPDNCSKYCECSGGIAWSFHCDANLLYNDIKHVCDWPNNVDCGSRPIVNSSPPNV